MHQNGRSDCWLLLLPPHFPLVQQGSLPRELLVNQRISFSLGTNRFQRGLIASCMLSMKPAMADRAIPVEQLEPASHVSDCLSFVEGYHYACYAESWGPRDFKLFASSVAASAIYYATRARVDIEKVHKLAARAVLRSTGSEENKEDHDEELAQCELVRDLFPNPDCSYTWQPKWSSPKVVELAKAIYERKVFEELPKLGKVAAKSWMQR